MRQSAYDKGLSLESKVSNLYDALRFEVKRNINISGHQIDLIASKYFSGVGLLSCMIEVKSRKKTIGINDVTGFINTRTHLIREGKIQSAIFVTDTNYSQDARAAVSDTPSIRLLTINELEKDLFNYGQCLVEWCRQYKNTSIFSTYIPLEGKSLKNENISDIVGYIDLWLSNNQHLVIISGDFGSGKTTIANRILYNQAQRYLSSDDAPFPIFASLRILRQYTDMFDFVVSEKKLWNKYH